MYPIDPKFLSQEQNLNPELLPNYSTHQNLGNGMNQGSNFQNHDLLDQKPSSINLNESFTTPNSVNVPDFSDACLKFLSDILLEENLDEIPATLQDFRALQATEKSLYDALGKDYSPSDNLTLSLDQSIVKTDDNSQGIKGYNVNGETTFGSNGLLKQTPLEPFLSLNNKVVNRSRRRKSQRRDEGGNEGERSKKLQASSNEDYVEMKQYDDILLCSENRTELSKKLQENSSKGKSKKQNKTVDEVIVDLRTLLTDCAQAVSSFDLRGANERLKQIRQHSSPYGDSIQRLAHHFANALEARLAGTGSTISSNIIDARISSSDFLKAYRVYVTAIPCKRMSFFLANNTISKLAEKSGKIHIIDFGVFLGLQWPCLIHLLTKRPNGPPKLRVTGIDYPQQGFRPAEKVEATGRRLAGYCERFNVDFQYQGIAKKWGSIKPEDVKIEGDELVIINCMYRSGTLLDDDYSQKDSFLKLVKQLNPQLFIHGIINAPLNAPFFITRFREVLFHYSSYFDLLEETIPREDHERLVLESELYAKEAWNVIACEGSDRIQRPETYKQWHVRTTKAGLKQLPLDSELLGRTKAKVKANYHKDFLVDEDQNWMIQGWKGRTLCALSFWQP